MTSKAQKDREERQVEAFLKSFPQAPTGICAASETPDFLVGNVGIELTEIFQGGGGSGGARTRRQESVYARICSRARDQHDSETHPLRVSVDFRESYLPRRRDIGRLAKELRDIVAENIPSGCPKTV